MLSGSHMNLACILIVLSTYAVYNFVAKHQSQLCRNLLIHLYEPIRRFFSTCKYPKKLVSSLICLTAYIDIAQAEWKTIMTYLKIMDLDIPKKIGQIRVYGKWLEI